MSYWAGYSGQGLCLNEDEFYTFLEKYKEKVPKTDSSIPKIEDFEDGEEDVQEIDFLSSKGEDRFSFFCADDGCCEGFRLFNYRINGKKNEKYESADTPDNNVYVLTCDNALDGMDCFEKMPYESYEAFVQEFIDKMGAYMPDDFDWDAHIGIYSYACYA